jgi:hypothetical protein
LADKLTGEKSHLLEVDFIDRKDLPPSDTGSEESNRTHLGEIAPERLVVLGHGRQPNTVVPRMLILLSKNEHDLIPYINRYAPEHRTSVRLERGELLENKIKGDLTRHRYKK